MTDISEVSPHIRRGEITHQMKRLALEGQKIMTAAQSIERALATFQDNLDNLYDVIVRLECSCGFPVPSKSDLQRLVSIEVLRQLQENAILFLPPADFDATIAGKSPPLPAAAHTLIVELNAAFQKSIETEDAAIRRAITGELSTSLYRNSN
ncbi:MAG TPA: hypothetical protein VMV19_09230 [Xanthobacteraceae bacterium]|nr:hypothetical protein [Xanthobacteraceae bacterium]